MKTLKLLASLTAIVLSSLLFTQALAFAADKPPAIDYDFSEEGTNDDSPPVLGEPPADGGDAVITYTLTYSAGTGGTISGSKSQIVSKGKDGLTVTAVPSSGYSFSKWSDNSTTNPRKDTNVTKNLSVTATFVKSSTPPPTPPPPATPDPKTPAKDLSKTGPETYVFLLLGLMLSLVVNRKLATKKNR